ncbi:vacuolar protein sorting-associated protein 35 [Cystobasidium minutum MCA 4210]|uniref:vacuolar protein sorting-associated protein 35 n=1 Tax=Cystobasidium minutum MCA 4210 TaxID=1397322 RepID=UPI0034CDC1BF|eukprot:jgi/Rhomi1/164077/estExt_Genewise1Plus.C_100078
MDPTPTTLAEGLANVKTQLALMRRSLQDESIMDALKAASTLLSELRTSSLSPKMYFELYIAVSDGLRYLSSFLLDSHLSGKQHLADLYELVQYAGNIVPRLYLMVTVGAVYMGTPDAPVKEIMRDLMEMCKGVQSPIRGMFLRHYLSGMVRDKLPIGDSQGPEGNLYDSLGFVLTNFVEMNKLWVRLQHQGLSRDREKRELERKELRILVGMNLVRLSQLEGVDLDMYRRIILPAILEQVVNCKDVIAQEYLMEVVIQVFPDEFHLRTLGPFLTATAQLHPRVNIKTIVIALLDKLAAYAAREAENEALEAANPPPPTPAKVDEKAATGAAPSSSDPEKAAAPDASTSSASAQEQSEKSASSANGDDSATATTANTSVDGSEKAEKDATAAQPVKPRVPEVKKYRGIPEDVKLFEVFWHQVVELIRARPDLTIQDVTALLVSLINLSLSCYPDRIDYVDQVLTFAKGKVDEYHNSADLHHPVTVQNLLALLVAPINAYATPLALLNIPTYTSILQIQPYASRRSIGHAVVSSILKKELVISTPEEVKGVLDLCHVLVRDQRDASIGMPTQFPGQQQHNNSMMGNQNGRMGLGNRGYSSRGGSQMQDMQEMAEEQGWIARLVHLFRSDDDEVQFKLLQTARSILAEGGDRIKWTFPPLIVSGVKLARRRRARALAQQQLKSPKGSTAEGKEDTDEDTNDESTAKASILFRFIHQVISTLYNSPSDSSEVCLRLYLLALQAADESKLEEIAYEFAVQAFTIYEESISESRSQLQAITLIINTLQQSRVFSGDNYDTLITKAALHGAKLLKKGHQANAVMLASHLWWQTETAGGEARPGKELVKDGKRVLECLQKALRIATNCIDELTTVALYVDALDQYIYYFERQVEAITPKHINSLIELITGNIDNLHSSDVHPTATNATSGLIEGQLHPDNVIQHFRSTLAYLHSRKESAISTHGTEFNGIGKMFDEVDLVGSLIKMGLN